jgi:hypothetical protein
MTNVINVNTRKEPVRGNAAGSQQRNPKEAHVLVNGANGAIPLVHPFKTANAVDRTLNAADADPQAVLMKVRELLVGPSQRLSEARLDELIKIFEEREAEMRASMEAQNERHNKNLKAAKQSAIEMIAILRDEFATTVNKLVADQAVAINGLKEMIAHGRKDLEDMRKESYSWVQASETATTQKLEAAEAFNTARHEQLISQIHTDMNLLKESLLSVIVASQREARSQVSRTLMNAGEELAKSAGQR